MVTPLWKATGRQVVVQKPMTRSQRAQHACQRGARLRHRHASSRPLDRNPHEAKLRDSRGQQDGGLLFFGGGNPRHGTFVVDVIGPTPSNEDADIQKECHGKSESRARTDSVVSGGWLSGAAKIIAPVCGQRTRRGFRVAGSEALARRRRYSETLIPSFLARDRIRRASSSVTLKVIVVIVIPYYRKPRPVNVWLSDGVVTPDGPPPSLYTPAP